MAKKLIKKIIVGFIILSVIFVFDYFLFMPKGNYENEDETINDNQEVNLPKENEDETINDNQEINLPKENENETNLKPNQKFFQLNVPFTSQSPFKKWDYLHNEACEETSLIMANYWLNSKSLNKKIADKKIKEAVAWQEKKWGGHFDLNVENTIKLAKDFFKINKIYFIEIENIDEIKYFLEQGKLILVPMAGRELENPYYRNPGPHYHMLVVTGFNEKEIVTNDPGTYRGENISFSNKNFFESIHNWPFNIGERSDLSKDKKAKEVLKGSKRIIIIEK